MLKVQSAKDLFIFLIKLGYTHCKPASRAWTSVLVMKRDLSVLCVQFRKNGVDIRYYQNYAGEIKVDASGCAHLLGGEIYRNHYNEAENFIHLKVATIAKCFSVGKLRPELFTQDGRSYRLNPKYQAIRNRSNMAFEKKREEMLECAEARAISNYIREDCEGYLGEGEWL